VECLRRPGAVAIAVAIAVAMAVAMVLSASTALYVLGGQRDRASAAVAGAHGRIDQVSAAEVRAAARAWAKAFLTGSVGDIRRMQGPECTPSTAPKYPAGFLEKYLRAERVALARHLGRPLNRVRIRSVRVRNVTTTSGEAEVVYDLPEDKVGNDNWVTYRLHDGRLRVADCNAPIGGESSAASAPTSSTSR
jgi:hypothetical protein